MPNWKSHYQAICQSKKLYLSKPEWVEKPNRTDYRMFTCLLMDESGISIPGIRVQGSSHTAQHTGYAVTSYMLQVFHGGDWLRAFAIDVTPAHARSHLCHKTRKPHFGPHLHYGDHRTSWFTWRPLMCHQPATNDGRYYRRFMRHIHLIEIDGLSLEPFGVNNGSEPDLFFNPEPLA